MIAEVPASTTVLVRYGVIPEVARASFEGAEVPPRGAHVVVQTHRGLELCSILEKIRPQSVRQGEVPASAFDIVRRAEPDDLAQAEKLAARSRQEFPLWQERITKWNLDLQLIDLEWTLDEAKLILYVLNERGPECTKLAIQAAAAGLGLIEVQPVSMEGRVTLPKSGGGCGSCGSH
ncbi:PSP1 C-terminal domain-containing protein [Planctomicrobium sp. SH664]|uniref:PSP1 C-terminal domain-containing protein n=1 Tax=Planctomicrobium sp. SH664 TaxID=3448125 RepID=UPI003F5C3D51